MHDGEMMQCQTANVKNVKLANQQPALTANSDRGWYESWFSAEHSTLRRRHSVSPNHPGPDLFVLGCSALLVNRMKT